MANHSETIYRATTLDGFCRIAVVEFRDGWRVYSRLNNGRTEQEPFPASHNTREEVLDKARQFTAIFAKRHDIDPETNIDKLCAANPYM
jgi:hypothetical protein